MVDEDIRWYQTSNNRIIHFTCNGTECGWVYLVYLRQRGGYIMFLSARVCLPVCKITQKRVHGFGWNVASTYVGTWKNCLTFQPDPDHSLDAGTGFLSPIAYALQQWNFITSGKSHAHTGIGRKSKQQRMVLRRRKTVVGGKCSLPSALLVIYQLGTNGRCCHQFSCTVSEQEAQLLQRDCAIALDMGSQKLQGVPIPQSSRSDFLVATSNRGHIVHGFRDTVAQRPTKIADFTHNSCQSIPPHRWSLRTVCTTFTSLKSRDLALSFCPDSMVLSSYTFTQRVQ